MSGRRILAMTRKEVIQIRRDPRSLLIIIAMPMIQLLIFGYAVNLDVKHIPLCVYDRDGDANQPGPAQTLSGHRLLQHRSCVGELPRRGAEH